MASFMANAARLLALAVTIAVSQVLAGLLTSWIPQPPIPDAGGSSPLTLAQSAAVVVGVWAVLLWLLTARVAGSYCRRSSYLFVYIYLVNCLLSAMEAAFYLPAVRMQGMNVVAMAASGAVFALLVAATAVAIVPAPRSDQPAMRRSARQGWVIIALYLAAYGLAGYFIAWQSDAVRSYYDQGRAIHVLWMLPLQLLRGAAWWGLTEYSVRRLRGNRVTLAVLVGATEAAFMAIALLIPGPLMPWPVRRAHLIEIGLSNLVFGTASILWMTTATQASRPSTRNRSTGQESI